MNQSADGREREVNLSSHFFFLNKKFIPPDGEYESIREIRERDKIVTLIDVIPSQNKYHL